MIDWRKEWFEFEDAVYLNAAAQGPLPRAAIRAVTQALEWKKFPHKLPDSVSFELPNRVRALLARLIGGRPEEVAITTGATSGLAAVAEGIDWKPGNEVLIARGEFPAHFAAWLPLEWAGRLKVVIVEPRGKFLTAEDFLACFNPRTRLVSASLVRFDDGSRLDAARLAAACHDSGALLLLDVTQAVGAAPLDVGTLGADFLIASGYKWLLSPYGTGFFWTRSEHIERMRPGPYYWMALEGAEQFDALSRLGFKLAPGARRWDSPETASFFNLPAMEASLEFLLRTGVQTVWEHVQRLTSMLIERLPMDRCVAASPSEAVARGPYVCVAARKPERNRELFERLRADSVIVSLRENALRIAPHLYNSERDIDRLLMVLAT